MTVDQVIDGILEREGGFVNHPADRQGATKFGITVHTLGGWRRLNRQATVEEMKHLSVAEAREIYRKQYVFDPGFDKIPHDGLRACVVDFGVTSGTARAVRWLQRSLGYAERRVTGMLDTETLRHLAEADPRYLLATLVAFRAYGMHRDALSDPKQAVFLKGWLNRAFAFLPFNEGYAA